MLALALLWPLLHAPAAGALDAEADATLQYELRPGDDPSRVARMFRISVDELLQRNGIRDPSRLRVGTMLQIPDPRAALVQELRADQEQLRGTVTVLRSSLDEQQARVARLETDLQRATAERDALQRRLTFYGATKIIAIVAFCVVLALAGALVLVLARLSEEAARRVATVKHLESLRAAVERHRNLGGQLELKYQNLYRQTQTDASTEAAVQALRSAYDQERAAVEARIEESAAAVAKLAKVPTRGRKHHKAA